MATKLFESLAQSLLWEKLLSFFLKLKISIKIYTPITCVVLHSEALPHGPVSEGLLVQLEDALVHDPGSGGGVISVSPPPLRPDRVQVELLPGVAAVLDQLGRVQPPPLARGDLGQGLLLGLGLGHGAHCHGEEPSS